MGSLREQSSRLIKLDGRYSHSNLFSHIIKFNCVNGYRQYHDAMQYCFQQWGMTVDVETYCRMLRDSERHQYPFQFSRTWSYLEKYGDHRIYLAEEAYTWIRLAEPFDL